MVKHRKLIGFIEFTQKPCLDDLVYDSVNNFKLEKHNY